MQKTRKTGLLVTGLVIGSLVGVVTLLVSDPKNGEIRRATLKARGAQLRGRVMALRQGLDYDPLADREIVIPD